MSLKSPEDEITRRILRTNKLAHNLDHQVVVKAYCAQDVVRWVNDWVWTFDPRKTPANIPFLLFPRQEEYLRWRTDKFAKGEFALVEKSRDMGVTWMNAAWQVHRWLFHPGYKGTFGSRKEDLVDKKGDPDSIFEKVRYILRYLPKWMLPAGFNPSSHDLYMRLINPENGSTITGEAGDNIGRGGRSSVVDIDEAAHIDHAESVDAALSANTNCVIYTSTPNGEGNAFAHKRITWAPDRIFSFHWRDDPRKDDAWYEEQKRRLPPHIIAQEIDIDYTASKLGITVPQQAVREALARGQAANFEKSHAAFQVGVDVARFGDDWSSVVVRQGHIIHSKYLDAWQGEDTMETSDKIASIIYRIRHEEGCDPWVHVDAVGVGAGVADRLRQLKFRVIDVQAGERAPDPMPPDPPSARKRDWLWWQARKFFLGEEDQIDEPAVITPDGPRNLLDQLMRELSVPCHSFTPGGNVKIESKADLKKRGIPSPNLADALIHTFEVKEARLPVKDHRPFRTRKERMKEGVSWMSR